MRRLLVLLVCLVPLAGRAQEELENPGVVLAVQDRAYRMNSELMLGLGFLPLDAFTKGIGGEVSYTYHFSDSIAWQIGRFLYSYNVATNLRTQLQRDFGVNPTAFPQTNWIAGSDFMWTPIYGKFAWLNSSVAHFEIYALGGISVVNQRISNDIAAGTTSTTFLPGIDLGVGWRFYVSKGVSFRLEVADNIVFGSGGVQNILVILLGVSFNFGSTE
ncbi:MAG TPA: outer membrane beta-barrel domain-containing protein [Myxococcaceae bacterium]|nr:outer membrane beta-barrel domain-containing protein [Myxococcaceae bacterium]